MRSMKKLLRGPIKYPLIVAAIAVLLFALGWYMLRDTNVPVLHPSGVIAQSESQLIIFTVALSAIVVIPVFILLVVFALRYREGNIKAKYAPEWAHSRTLEVVWWGIPILIILVLSIVTWVSSHQLDPYKDIEGKAPMLEVDVVALQWKWLFIYPEQGVASVNELVIPVDRPVHFNLTADAPMSAFWIPALGSQIYSMDGMHSIVHLMATQKGTYTGYNTNINGAGYADMTFRVQSTSNGEFDAWIKRGLAAPGLDMTSYARLEQPSKSGVVQYSLSDKQIFDKVMAKYMTSQGHDTASDHQMNGMDHSKMNMEGM